MSFVQKIMEKTPTRFWVNNPNMQEIEAAIAAGVLNCTTNPAYCSKLIKSDPDYLNVVIDRIIATEKDDDVAADLVYQEVSKRIMDSYRDIYNKTNGTDGYVTIQLDPRVEKDADVIVEGARRHSKLGPNFMCKIPVTEPGSRAIEQVLRMGIPVCATEVFSLSQALYVAKIHRKVCKEIGKHVPMFLTHITGIYDEYLQKLCKIQGIDMSPEALRLAGAAVCRKQYAILSNEGYEVTMLGGGARAMYHFTDFVGGKMDVTLNWNIIEEIDKIPGEPVDRIGEEIPESIINELLEKLPDFRKAYDLDALTPEEFGEYGPVRLFMSNFLEGYYLLLAQINVRRAQQLQ